MKKGWQTKTLGEVLEKTETVNPVNPVRLLPTGPAPAPRPTPSDP